MRFQNALNILFVLEQFEQQKVLSAFFLNRILEMQMLFEFF